VGANLYGLVAELIVASTTDVAIHSLQQFLDQLATAVKKEDLDAYFWSNVVSQEKSGYYLWK